MYGRVNSVLDLLKLEYKSVKVRNSGLKYKKVDKIKINIHHALNDSR